MAELSFFLVPTKKGWNINTGDGTRYGMGPFALHAALGIAIQAAHNAGKAGHPTNVLIQETGGKWRIEWAYGRDQYLPHAFGHTEAPASQQEEATYIEPYTRKK